MAVASLDSVPGGQVVAESSTGRRVSSITWLTEGMLLIGSIDNTELHVWRFHNELGRPLHCLMA